MHPSRVKPTATAGNFSFLKYCFVFFQWWISNPNLYHFKVAALAFRWNRLWIRFAHLHIPHFRSIIGRGQGKKDQGYGCHDQSNIIYGWRFYIVFLGDAKKTKITCEPTHEHVAQIPDCQAKAKSDDFDDVWAHPYMDRHNEIKAWSSFPIHLPKSCKNVTTCYQLPPELVYFQASDFQASTLPHQLPLKAQRLESQRQVLKWETSRWPSQRAKFLPRATLCTKFRDRMQSTDITTVTILDPY